MRSAFKFRFYAEKFVTVTLPMFAAFGLMGCDDCDKIEAVRPYIQALKRDFDSGVSTNTTRRCRSRA